MELHINTLKPCQTDAIRRRYRDLTETLIRKQITITTMESCTAGLIISLITDTEGSSEVVKGAFVTYSNEAKILQGVPAQTIRTFGIYSAETAAAMAKACRAVYHADIGIGVTGTLSNVDPANQDSIPGEVFFAIATEGAVKSYKLEMEPQYDRPHGKMAVAGEVAEQLLVLLSEFPEKLEPMHSE